MTEVPVEVSEAGGPPSIDAPDLDMTPGELLARSDEAMRELEFFRVFVEDPGHGFSLYETTAPGELASVVFVDLREGRGGLEYHEYRETHRWPGHDIFGRSDGPEILVGPDLDTSAHDVRVIGIDDVAGRDAWVIWYWGTVFSVEGPFTEWKTEWIDQETLWLLRQETSNDDPLGSPVGVIRAPYDFNDPTAPRRYPMPVPDAKLQYVPDSVVLRATADTVVDENEPTRNFEGSGRLRVDGALRNALLRFDVELPEGARVLTASLGLYVRDVHIDQNASDYLQRLATVHLVTGGWDASAVMWENAPMVGEQLGELTNTVDYPTPQTTDYRNTWVQVDVTEVTRSGRLDFYLVDSGDRRASEFAASEADDFGPILYITYEWPRPLLVPTVAP
ncbi:MAG: DNRLRE domain-containing protein [Dehalococcoidia bacterium]|nr:DNRLRE domain-containing protein [Dehalococcoidia bacterium]